MKSIPTALSDFVENIMILFLLDLLPQILVLYIGLLFQQEGHLIQSILPHISKHFLQLFLEILVIVLLLLVGVEALFGW